MRGPKVLALATVLALGAVLTAGCSSGDDDDKKSSDGGGVTVAPDEGTPVAVALGETADEEQYMKVSPASVVAGPVTFTVTNKGTEEHEVMVIEPGTPFDELEINADGRVDESTRVGGEIELEEGKAGTLTVDLEAGTYVLVCNKEDHYGKGMRAEFTVT